MSDLSPEESQADTPTRPAAPPSIFAVLLGTGWRKLFWLSVLLAVLGYLGVKHYGEWEAQQMEVSRDYFAVEAFRDLGSFRVAYITDIHENRQQLAEAIDALESAKPDLIILGGDLVMVGERMKRTRQLIGLLRQLSDIAPTYSILGNQDMERLPEVQRVLEESRIKILRNERLSWNTPSGKPLTIIGLGEWNEGDMKPKLCMMTPGSELNPVLLLSHDPESRWELTEYDWDFMLSGHTHGGQLGNPLTGEYISFRSSMPAGLYDFGENQQIFVSRGLGSIWGMRFFCRPEIHIIDFVAARS